MIQGLELQPLDTQAGLALLQAVTGQLSFEITTSLRNQRFTRNIFARNICLRQPSCCQLLGAGETELACWLSLSSLRQCRRSSVCRSSAEPEWGRLIHRYQQSSLSLSWRYEVLSIPIQWMLRITTISREVEEKYFKAKYVPRVLPDFKRDFLFFFYHILKLITLQYQ